MHPSSAPDPSRPTPTPVGASPETAFPPRAASLMPLLGWALVGALAIALLWLAGRRSADRALLAVSRLEIELASLENQDLRQQLEAERLLSAAQLDRMRANAFPPDIQLHALRAMDNTGRLSLHLVACAAWSPALGKGELRFAGKLPPEDRKRRFVLTVSALPDEPGPRLAEFAAGVATLAFATPPGTDANARFFIHELKDDGLAPVAASRPMAGPESD